MNPSSDPLLEKIHRLATRQQEGELSDEDRAEFNGLLRTPFARRLYLKYMQDSASLRWIFSGHHLRSLPRGEFAESTVQRRRRPAVWWSLAIAAGLAGVALIFNNLWNTKTPRAKRLGAAAVAASDLPASGGPANGGPASDASRSGSQAGSVATVTVLSGVEWKDAAPGPRLLSRVAIGEQLEFSGGTVELTFDGGAQVKVFGPAHVEISSPMSILCSRGRVTTLVGDSGKGFTIDTPKARIVDLGTQFGVNISEKGDTQVVVFQGSVDLSPSGSPGAEETAPPAAATAWRRRMQQGDALTLDDSGEAQRLVAVQRSDFFPAPTGELSKMSRRLPTILDVRDNIRPGESTKCYQIVRGGLREDAASFVDRSHQWNGIDEGGLPEFLVGADYIMPFNDDKFIRDLRVEVDISRPATCYVFLDKNMSPPKWLRDSFQDTGLELGLDGANTVWHRDHEIGEGAGRSVDFRFSVWQRDIDQPGAVVFGGVSPPEPKAKSRGFNMYGIAVVPK